MRSLFQPVNRSRTYARIVLLMCSSWLIGCGAGADDGPARFRVSGKVTFNGKPVAAGTIYFEPHAEKGNRGPAGSAQIKNGQYDTNNGKGVVGGPHLIMIDGYDGNATADAPFGKPIFVPHTVEEDLPKSDTTKDIDVPASAAEGLVTNPEPA
jgi:hypothetical protein